VRRVVLVEVHQDGDSKEAAEFGHAITFPWRNGAPRTTIFPSTFIPCSPSTRYWGMPAVDSLIRLWRRRDRHSRLEQNRGNHLDQ
jgi:hypothetical protein